MKKTTINEAIKLWHAGEFRSAIAKLSPLLSENPSHPVINGLLGAINYDAHKYKSAYRHFELTFRSSPKSEVSLRGMVHSALRLGWRKRALNAAQQLAALTGRKADSKLLESIGA
jgi:predicted Zn-dependent protease